MLSHIRLPAGLAALAATAYLLLMNADIGFAAHTILKGSAVAILALAAAAAARSTDGWLLAAVMALGAAGDVLIEFTLIAGAAAFAVGHVAAIGLYYRNRRPAGSMPVSQPAAATALLLSAPLELFMPLSLALKQ